MLITWILGATFVVIVLVNVVLGSALGQRRIDGPRTLPLGSGRSGSWQVNLLIYAKYDRRGELIRRWIVALLVAQAVIAVALILRLVL